MNYISDGPGRAAVSERELEGRLTAGEGRELCYALKYPHLPACPRACAYYLSGVRGYERVIKGRYGRALYSMPEGKYEINGGFETGFNNGSIVSIYMDTYESLGPYRTGLGRTSATWDVSRGRQVGLENIFSDPAMINRLAARKIDADINDAQSQSPGSYFFAIGRRTWDWYLSERGLVVYFAPGAIAPANGGIPSFFLSWDEIGRYARFKIEK